MSPLAPSHRAHRSHRASTALLVALLVALLGVSASCTRVPSPLNPAMRGSIGTPSRGVLTEGTNLAATDSLKWLRQNDRHWGTARFTQAITRAADRVAKERPGAPLYVGDLSTPRGGQLLPHFSHRNGRDADLLLFLTTLDGAPVDSPGFVSFDADGLAWDPRGHRFVRFDVEREWLLVRALLSDDDARIQWIFMSEVLEAIMIEWARARGDDPELILRAQEVMLQPNPGGVHDDHIHIRTACSDEEIVQGCEHTGPRRAWMKSGIVPADRTEDLVVYMFKPIDTPIVTSSR